MVTSISSARPARPEVGWWLWLLVFVGIAISVGLRPEAHTVTPEYRGAAEKWIRSEDIYILGTIHGYLYLPSAALLYLPVTFLPESLGEIVWRLFTVSSMAIALWQVTGLLLGQERNRLFWLVTLLTIPACFSSARNGQTNLPLSAFMLLAVVDLAGERWNRAALWLALTLLLKPIAMVMILLVMVMYPPMRLRLVLGVLGVLLLPWLRLDWPYVWRQHILFYQKMALATAPKEDVFYDLRGMLIQMGLHPSDKPLQIFRTLAGGVVLALTWFSAKKVKNEVRSAFLLGALSAAYLMIFNPRTETNSYVILAPFIAVMAIRVSFLEQRALLGWVLVFLALTLGTDSYGGPIFHATNLWLKVVSALVFLGILTWEIVLNRLWRSSPVQPSVGV